ncbi:hypothetical protein H9636_07235 [Ureibacillus sp. Re31]|uniref:Uncharacterized protein n=1 Tax=Ureibacillus galli TaxID=2762222 RepID=A0ABR8XBB5_9BACL|nr:hypothetical protein [Ureibacillus galli]MBD8026451.1 hypothetical protein [Ureibacillus galli]
MNRLKAFTVKETVVTEKITTVYASNKKDVYSYLERGINSSPEVITTNSTLLITLDKEAN